MTFCGIGDLGAAIDVTFMKESPVNVQEILDQIWNLRNDKELAGVTVHQVGASFGEIDATVYIKTKLEVMNGTNPTWRLALFAQKVWELKNVATIRTRILIHDPHHDSREDQRGERAR